MSLLFHSACCLHIIVITDIIMANSRCNQSENHEAPRKPITILKPSTHAAKNKLNRDIED